MSRDVVRWSFSDTGSVDSKPAPGLCSTKPRSVCTGPPAMSGQGEITFTDDTQGAYNGAIRYASEGRVIVINLTGERIDTCDYQE